MRRALLLLALVGGCYRHHLRDDDAGATRCGSAHCARVDPSAPRLHVEAAGLVGNVEGEASALRGAPEIDGVAFELDPCFRTGEEPCPVTVRVSNVGADLADPAVLIGPVEATIRDRAIVVRGDACPGCDDGHAATQLYFAAVGGELAPGFDLDLADVVVSDGGVACSSRGVGGESSGRNRLRFASTFSASSVVLDETETRALSGTELVVRLLRSSYECVIADLPPPRPLEAAEWVIWNVAGM
jgi:hypothetical protein